MSKAGPVVRALPVEMWRAVVEASEDWEALLSLSLASHQMRCLVMGAKWTGLRDLRLSQTRRSGDELRELRTGHAVSAKALVASLLPRSAALRRLSLTADLLHTGPTHHSDTASGPDCRSSSLADATRLLGSLLRSSWLRRLSARAGGHLTALELSESFAVSPDAAGLVKALGPRLTELSVLACKERARRDNARLYDALGRCRGLRRLSLGFCKDAGETSSADALLAALADKPALEQLLLRGMTLLSPQLLFRALQGTGARGLERLGLESCSYANDFFQLAATAADKGVLAGVRHFSLAKCGFIFAPLLLSVMTRLELLEVSLLDMAEVVKLALSFLVEYAGDASRPSFLFRIRNDVRRARHSRRWAAETLEGDCVRAIRAIGRRFRIHFDVSLVEVPLPARLPDDLRGGLAKRFVVSKGRALVFLDTLFTAQHVHPLPPARPAAQAPLSIDHS